MKGLRLLVAALLFFIIAGTVWFRWKGGEVRRAAIHTLGSLDNALRTGNSTAILKTIVIPAAVQGRTEAEQVRFLTKALSDEISGDGLAVLQREGSFGPLLGLFPAEGASWAGQAGAKPEDCVAFRMVRRGIRAEAVLLREGRTFRIIRCNNIRQMAQARQHL